MANEKRLIYADALKANFVVSGEFEKDLWHAGAIRTVIDNAPTVDAVEVVHGRWNFDEELIMWGHPFVCSACGMANCSISKYCPHCGAKMDG